MTIKQALRSASDKLRRVSDTPWLDAEVLLAYSLWQIAGDKIERSWLYVHPEEKLTKKQYSKYQRLISRRLKHEPVAYITHHKEFYGLDFYVSRRVMIPRPETEFLIDEVISLVSSLTALRNAVTITIADIGTGSGCIAVALAKHLKNLTSRFPLDFARGRSKNKDNYCSSERSESRTNPSNFQYKNIKIHTTDISNGILKIAKKNARKHKVLSKITFLKGDLLKPLKNRKIDIMVANPPYLTHKQWLSTKPDIRFYEPQEALDGGKDGLDYIKKLLYQVAEAKLRPLTIILEIGGRTQANKIKNLVKKYFSKLRIEIKKDLAGLDRVICIYP